MKAHTHSVVRLLRGVFSLGAAACAIGPEDSARITGVLDNPAEDDKEAAGFPRPYLVMVEYRLTLFERELV